MKLSTAKRFEWGIAYTCCVTLATALVALLPFVGLVVLIGAVVGVAIEERVVAIVLGCMAGMGFVTGYLLRQRDAMVTIRAGAWPALFRGDRRPRTHRLERLHQLLSELTLAHSERAPEPAIRPLLLWL